MFSWFKGKKKTFREVIEDHSPLNFKEHIQKHGQNSILPPQPVNTKHIIVLEGENDIFLANFYLDGVNEDPVPIMSINKATGEISETVHGKFQSPINLLEIDLLKFASKKKKCFSSLIGVFHRENVNYDKENNLFLVFAEMVKPCCMFYNYPVFEIKKVTVLSTRSLKIKNKLTLDFNTVSRIQLMFLTSLVVRCRVHLQSQLQYDKVSNLDSVQQKWQYFVRTQSILLVEQIHFYQ